MGLTNSQYNSIMRKYDDTRHFHQRELAQRLARIYAECPRLKDIHEQLTEAGASMARAKISADSKELAQALSLRRQLQKERDSLLAAHGYDLDLHYTCPDCRDTGYIGSRKCHCFRQQCINLQYENSGIWRSVLEQENFSHFDLRVYSDRPNPLLRGKSNREHMKQICRICREYAQNFPGNGRSLLIFGPTGVGKTFLMNCIAKEVMDRGFAVVYTAVSDLYDIAARKHTDPGSCFDMDEYLFDCDLLIIDDLGAENLSPFKKSYLLNIINSRLNRQQPAIISTNLNPDELQDYYDERISSRLVGSYEPIPILGNDIRVSYEG